MAKAKAKAPKEKEPSAPKYYATPEEQAKSITLWHKSNRPLNEAEFLAHIKREYGDALIEVISREDRNFLGRVHTIDGTKISVFSLPLALIV